MKGCETDATENGTPVLRLQDLVVEFRLPKAGRVQAVSGITFQISRGETVGLVGESGCGKSSLAGAIMQLPPPNSGTVLLDGENLTRMDGKRLRNLRPKFQIIFQDAVSALNPSRKIGHAIAMPLRVGRGSRSEEPERVREMMVQVGLDPLLYHRKPFEMSGGQCQRVQIARALITQPRLLVCDEPVSSLDLSIQAQILNLLEELRRRYRLTMLFISHDLAVVKNVSDRVAVMYLGKICEIGPSEALYRSPAHPYTEALLGAVPLIESVGKAPTTTLEPRERPSPLRPPTGCRFRLRCPGAICRCASEEPEMVDLGGGRQAACHRV